jgi:hypothetical protein
MLEERPLLRLRFSPSPGYALVTFNAETEARRNRTMSEATKRATEDLPLPEEELTLPEVEEIAGGALDLDGIKCGRAVVEQPLRRRYDILIR